MSDYSLILTKRYAGKQWSLSSDDYEGLTWLDSSKKPSKAELDALWSEVQAEVQREIVERQRKAAYAVESDPVFFQYQRGDATEQEWLAAVQAVKDRFPYPV